MRSKKSGRCLMALTLSVVMLFPAPMSYAAEKGEGMEEVGTEADAVNPASIKPDLTYSLRAAEDIIKTLHGHRLNAAVCVF